MVRIKTKEGEDMRRTDREVKDAEGILQILESCKVCRIGMMDGEKVLKTAIKMMKEAKK